MLSDDRVPGVSGDDGAAVGESAHAASASVAAAASRMRIVMTAPSELGRNTRMVATGSRGQGRMRVHHIATPNVCQ